MMNREGFVKLLARLSAGELAQPDQIAAFEHYFNVNTPNGEGPFVAVDQVYLVGLADRTVVLTFSLYLEDQLLVPLGYNAFGGIVCWGGALHKTVGRPEDIRWKVCQFYDGREHPIVDAFLRTVLRGFIAYVDQSGKRYFRKIVTAVGSLA